MFSAINRLLIISVILLFSCNGNQENSENKSEFKSEQEKPKKDWAIVIHGGAGTILKKNMTPEKEQQYLDKLNEVLDKGKEVLSKGGSSLDAVEQCIHIMEDSPLFNAGKGSVFTYEEKNKMDASIMEGKTLNAGAVSGVSVLKNPISAARLVMEKSPHVMLSGRGAEQFCHEQGVEFVDPSYFFTPKRYDHLLKVKQREDSIVSVNKDEKFGTVGIAALDRNGDLAAGTSTGGMTNKRWGRVGDSPIIGAGTYANNKTCAVSATGHGEYFIRANVAYDISALIEYKEMSIDMACDIVVMQKLVEMGGEGGVIALDANGNHSMTFNTEGMYRGFANSEGGREVLIYKSDLE